MKLVNVKELHRTSFVKDKLKFSFSFYEKTFKSSFYIGAL